jgi:uncharacterized protein YhfF
MDNTSNLKRDIQILKFKAGQSLARKQSKLVTTGHKSARLSQMYTVRLLLVTVQRGSHEIFQFDDSKLSVLYLCVSALSQTVKKK